mgnify:CR=1 FL=1
MRLTVVDFKKQYEKETRQQLRIKPYIIDITSVAVRKQHKPRYPKFNGKTIKIDAIVLKRLNQNKGWFSFVAHTDLKREMIHRFLEKVGIDKDQIIHDKDFLFNFGETFYYAPTVKQAIEHIFGFKKAIYEMWKRKEIKNMQQLLDLYRKYFSRLGLEEVKLY